MPAIRNCATVGKMSLYPWLSNKRYLPNPAREETKKKGLEVAQADKRVSTAIYMETRDRPRRSKRPNMSYELKSASRVVVSNGRQNITVNNVKVGKINGR